MSFEPQLVELRLQNLDVIAAEGLSPGIGEFQSLYMWMIFFKIDGDSVSIVYSPGQNPSFSLQGTATLLDMPGNHGDLTSLPTTGASPSNSYAIPGQVGLFHTTLKQILPDQSVPEEVAALIPPTPGQVGCIAWIMMQYNTSDDAIAAGHNAFNSGVGQQLNALIPTLQSAAFPPDAVTQMEQNIQNSVEGAVENAMNLWQKLGVVLGGDSPDTPLVSAGTPSEGFAYTEGGPYFLVGQDTLLAASSNTVPLQAKIEAHINTVIPGNRPPDAKFDAVVVLNGQARAWPYPLSLKLFLKLYFSNTLTPPIQLGRLMGAGSLQKWIASVWGNWLGAAP
jgi:hypothetical protein